MHDTPNTIQLSMSSSFVLVSVAVVPFTGVLVRYRAAYYPKHLPDSSDGLVPGTATAPTFVGIWKRVWGIEVLQFLLEYINTEVLLAMGRFVQRHQ